MNIVKRCTILGIGRPYSFIPTGSTEELSGCKMFYIDTDDFKTPRVDSETGTLGYFPQEKTMSVGFYDNFKGVGYPAVADFEFDISFTPKGAVATLVDIKFVNSDAKVSAPVKEVKS